MLSLDYQLPPGETLEKYHLHRQRTSLSASPQLQHNHHQRQKSAPEDILPEHRLSGPPLRRKRHSVSTAPTAIWATKRSDVEIAVIHTACKRSTKSEKSVLENSGAPESYNKQINSAGDEHSSSSTTEQPLTQVDTRAGAASDTHKPGIIRHSRKRRPYYSECDYTAYSRGYNEHSYSQDHSKPNPIIVTPVHTVTVTPPSDGIVTSSTDHNTTELHVEKTLFSQNSLGNQERYISSHSVILHQCQNTENPNSRITVVPEVKATVASSCVTQFPTISSTVPSIDQASGRPGYLQSKSWPPSGDPGKNKRVQSPHLLCVVEAEDDLSDWESPVDIDLANPPVRQKRQSSWRKIRSFILWSPFIQVFKKHRYPWIQLAGHQGNFHAGEAGSVLKKLDTREHACFQKLMADSLKEHVPEYRGDVDKNGETYIQLQDLLCSFNHPCVMDVKMGVRTYLEDELHKARRSPTLRKDMYQKMMEIDTTAPTTEEHEHKAVTKPRYMQWRDEMSSSVELGFRVEGIKKSDGNSSKDFKKTKTRDNIVDILKSFVGDNENIVAKYVWKLKEVMRTQESSEFFKSHEVIGSSLLFVHDAEENVGVWMIDFGKTEALPKGVKIDHRSEWVEGNHEDGYLFGLDNLITILEEVQVSLTSSAV